MSKISISTIVNNILITFLLTANAAALLLLFTPNSTFALDPFYHDSDEIYLDLLSLQDVYSDWVVIDSVGHSSEYNMPIWMAKISDHPDRLEPEPALLFIGQVHAEEVEGVEITLQLMRLLLENQDDDAHRARLEGLELYFIPSANPEGLDVVHSGLDEYFRKNCRDNIGDGEFRYHRGWGWDTSGVDINRNFGLHWNRGQDLYERGDEQAVYNYYRGPAPFSEPESQAIASLALQRRFQYSISYHSSRSCENSETVIAPWNWEGKTPPDADAINAVHEAIAERIPCQDGFGTYDPVHALQRNGQTPDWFYQAAGAFQYMIEIGDGIQPDSIIMQQLVNDNIDAALFIMDLAIGSETLAGFGTLTVLAADARTSETIEAFIYIEQLNDPILEQRKTATGTGRFDWLLPVNNYDVIIEASGYRSLAFEHLAINDGERTIIRPELNPLDQVQIQFRARDSFADSLVTAQLKLIDNCHSITIINLPVIGNIVEMPVGIYHAEVIADGYVPLVCDLELEEGCIWEFDLYAADIVFDEEFDELDQWQSGGFGNQWGIVESDNRTALTESVDSEYVSNSTAWILIPTSVDFDDEHSLVLRLIHLPYFEPGADRGDVIVWDWEREREQMVTIASFSQFPNDWDTTYISLDDFSTGEIWVRFGINTDGAVEEEGWLIDRMTLFRSRQVLDVNEPVALPKEISFYVFPNPANSVTRVILNLPVAGHGRIDLYDGNGRHLTVLTDHMISPGKYSYLIDSSYLPSGSYYLNLQTDYSSRLLRLTFVK